MLGVDEALGKVLEAAGEAEPLPDEEVALASACGRVLHETIVADQDMPPFTRSAMDGYAVRAADVANAPVSLDVIEVIAAGAQPRRAVGPGQASKIMTGAALPPGADAVQMIEKTRVAPGQGPAGDSRVTILAAVPAGEHVRRAGEDLGKGAILLAHGEMLGPSAIALLASAGRPRIRVSRRPRVAIIPTGDELVAIEETPGHGRIRESNGHALRALVELAGGEPRMCGIARDDRADLTDRINRALFTSDILLLSGGVSMGDYDLVGQALIDRGCTPVFDRVAIQPGKPLFFARREGPGARLIFGLPGNPVSTMVDFILFARPAMRRLMGAASTADPEVVARLEAPVRRHAGRRAYLPASLVAGGEGMILRLLPSMGSADMVAMSRADALAIIPEDASKLEAGVRVRALPLGGLTR